MVRYIRNGCRRRITLGRYPALKLADARAKAKEILYAVYRGEDPLGEKQAAKNALTFAELAEEYLERHAKLKKRRWKEDQRILRVDHGGTEERLSLVHFGKAGEAPPAGWLNPPRHATTTPVKTPFRVSLLASPVPRRYRVMCCCRGADGPFLEPATASATVPSPPFVFSLLPAETDEIDTQRNARHIETLAKALASQGAGSVLIGAGSSVSCGYPGWSGFLQELLSAFEPEQAARLGELRPTTLVDKVQELLKGERFTQIFRRTFAPERATEGPPRWLRLLFDLELDLYITTNYTHEVETVSHDYGFDPALLWYAQETPGLVRRVGTKRALYLHGRYDDDPHYRPPEVRVVLGEQSYKNAYFTPGRVRSILRTVATSTTLVIVGASLADKEIGDTLRAVAAESDQGPPHYVIYELWPPGHPRHQDPEALETTLLSEYHLQPIFYEVEMVADKPVFHDLVRVVSHIAAAIAEQRARLRAAGERPRDLTADASLAINLTRLLPSPRDFAAVARSVHVDTTRKLLQRTPLDRWSGLVSIGRRMGTIEALRAAARNRLPHRRHEELRTAAAPTPALIDRTRVTAFVAATAPAQPYLGPLSRAPDTAAARDALGLLALDRYWGIGSPENPQVQEWRDAVDAEASAVRRALEKKLLTVTDKGEVRLRDAEGDLGFALAADLVARRSAADFGAGERLLGAALPRLAEYDAYRQEILVHALAWWPAGAHLVERFLDERFAAGGGSVDVLLAVTFAQRLLREAGRERAAMQIPAPISVQWAERHGLEAYVASVLEILGEQRVEVYLDRWLEAKGPARTALARAIRRCAWHGPPVAHPVLAAAIEASRPETPLPRILALIAKPPVRALWLDILPADPGAQQIEALGELLAPAIGWRAQRLAQRAVELLCEHPDLLLVWDALGEHRCDWVEHLEPARLLPGALTALREDLQKRTLSAAEQWAFARLGERLKEATPPSALEKEA